MKRHYYTAKEVQEVVYMLAEDLGIEKAEFTNGDSSKIIDTFLLSYLLANADDIADLWNDED